MNPMRFFMHKKRHRYVNGGCQGIISIMLCIVMLPFFSLASILIETYRYQHVVESLREISELAGVSVLADYDSYLNERFGLLAVSQENLSNDIYTEFAAYYEENLGMLGGTVSLKKAEAKAQSGSSFSEIFLAEQELLDYCELNVTVDASTDFLEQIVGKLQDTQAAQNITKLQDQFERVEKTASAAVDVMEAVNNLCDKLEGMQSDADALEDDWKLLKTTIDERAPGLTGTSGKDAVLRQKYQAYKTDVEEIESDVEELGTCLDEIQTSFDTLERIMAETADTASTIDGENVEGGEQIDEVAASAMDAYREIYEEFKNIINQNINEDIQPCYDQVKETVGDIVNYPADDFEKDLRNCVAASGSLEEFELHLKVGLKDLTEDDALRTAVDDVISDTAVDWQPLREKMQVLVDAVDKLFSLDAVDENLNTTIPASYRMGDFCTSQQLLDTITGLKKNISDLGDYINSEEWSQYFREIKEIISDIKTVFQDVGEAVLQFNSQMKVKLTNGLHGMLRLWLIAEYMERNLPNRVNYASETGVTGYAYTDIPNSANVYKGAELEYILAGNDSETDSQKNAFMNIYFIRFLLDMPVTLRDANVLALSESLGTVPVVGPALSVAIYAVYSIAEPFCDTMLLANSQAGDDAVSIGEKDYSYLTSEGIGGFVYDIKKTKLDDGTWESLGSEDGSKSQLKGPLTMTYQQYMLLLLMINHSEEEIMEHFLTMVRAEAEAYYQQKGSSFDMNKACTCIQMDTEVEIETILNTDIMNGLYQVHLTSYRGY